MSITVKEIEGIVRNTPLNENETIVDLLYDIDKAVSDISYFEAYWRHKSECPFARGNLVIDITYKDDSIMCIKLLYETTPEQLCAFMHPLMIRFPNYEKEIKAFKSRAVLDFAEAQSKMEDKH